MIKNMEEITKQNEAFLGAKQKCLEKHREISDKRQQGPVVGTELQSLRSQHKPKPLGIAASGRNPGARLPISQSARVPERGTPSGAFLRDLSQDWVMTWEQS